MGSLYIEGMLVPLSVVLPSMMPVSVVAPSMVLGLASWSILVGWLSSVVVRVPSARGLYRSC